MYRLFLALRYLLTRPINLLGMLGIMLSVWALVVVVSLFSGFLAVIERHVQEASADISVTALPPEADWNRLRLALRDDPNVDDAAPRALHFGLLGAPGRLPPPPSLPGRSALHGGDQPFLFVYGVDAAAEHEVSGFGAWLADPDIPAALRVADPARPFAVAGDAPGVLIGLDRMRREGYRPGDPLELTTGRLHGQGGGEIEPITVALTVAGAFKTRHGGFDGNIVFLELPAMHALLAGDSGRQVQEIAVRVRDPEQLDETRRRLQSAVGRVLDRGDYRRYGLVQTWRERNANYLASIDHQRALLKIVLVVILVVAAFLMLATLSMMVTEKVGDIGILTAMGATPPGVTALFLCCGLAITLLGVLLGTASGVVTAVYLEEIRQFVLWAFGKDLFPLDVYNLDRVPCAIDGLWIAQVAALALATGCCASALPAWRAARHDPLVSLRAN
jgi:lipoprotein-releasing system permease protein